MEEFISITDAVAITGKSKSTIRRIIAELKKKGDNPSLLIKEQGVTAEHYLINKEYLFKRLNVDPSKPLKKPSNKNDKDALIKKLEDEIAYLRKQVEIHQQEKQQLIKKLPSNDLLDKLLELENKRKKLI